MVVDTWDGTAYSATRFAQATTTTPPPPIACGSVASLSEIMLGWTGTYNQQSGLSVTGPVGVSLSRAITNADGAELAMVWSDGSETTANQLVGQGPLVMGRSCLDRAACRWPRRGARLGRLDIGDLPGGSFRFRRGSVR
jgi:hypothetical protein